MKKIFMSLFLILVLAVCPIFMTGCEEEGDYWTPVMTNINDNFITSEVFADYFTDETIVYTKNNTSLNTTFSEKNNYKELLNTYDILAKSFLYTIRYTSNILGNEPVIKAKQGKVYFLDLQNKINEFKKQANALKNAKEDFLVNDGCISTDNLSSQINLQILKEFKINYRELLKKAQAVQNSFSDLYKNCYLNLPTEDSGVTISAVIVRYFAFKKLETLNNCAFAYLCETNEHKEKNVEKLPSNIINIYNYAKSVTEEVTYEEYQEILNYDKLLSTSVSRFNKAIENFDCAQYIENGTSYLDSTTKNVYSNIIYEFIENSY